MLRFVRLCQVYEAYFFIVCYHSGDAKLLLLIPGISILSVNARISMSGNSGIRSTSYLFYYSTISFSFFQQKGGILSLFAYFLVTATKKTPETLDHLQDSRSPDLRLDYYLIRSGVFMFQDIYCPVIMLKLCVLLSDCCLCCVVSREYFLSIKNWRMLAIL